MIGRRLQKRVIKNSRPITLAEPMLRVIFLGRKLKCSILEKKGNKSWIAADCSLNVNPIRIGGKPSHCQSDPFEKSHGEGFLLWPEARF